MMFQNRYDALKHAIQHLVTISTSLSSSYLKSNYSYTLIMAYSVMVISYHDNEDEFETDFAMIASEYKNLHRQGILGMKIFIKERVFVDDVRFQIFSMIYQFEEDTDRKLKELVSEMDFTIKPNIPILVVDSYFEDTQQTVREERKIYNHGVFGANINTNHGFSDNTRIFNNPHLNLHFSCFKHMGLLANQNTQELKNGYSSDFKQYNNRHNKKDVKLSPLLKSIINCSKTTRV